MTYSQVIQYQKIPGQFVRVFLFNNKKSMKYILKKDGKEIEAIAERWMWGVVYKLTPEQIAEQKQLTKRRDEQLVIEMKERIEKVKDDEKAVENLKNHFEEIMSSPVAVSGEELRQFSEDGIFHQFKEIEQERVAMFVMYKFENENKRIDLVVEGKQIFHFYRTIVLAYNTPQKRTIRIYGFGFKDGDKTNYNFILPDDRMVISDHDLDLTKFNI